MENLKLFHVFFDNNIREIVEAATEANAKRIAEHNVNYGCDEFWPARRVVEAEPPEPSYDNGPAEELHRMIEARKLK